MDFLTQMWLPIVVSAAAVWIASAVIWMALPHHTKDRDGLPDEEGFKQDIRARGIGPGVYMFPYAADRKSCNSPEFKKKWEEGPAGMLTIFPKMNMGVNMALTLITYLVVSVLIAYVASLVAGSIQGDKAKIFQVIGTIGVLAYSFAFIPNNVWFGAKPRATFMNIVDGVAYGLITGAVFMWLWPDTMTPPAL